jgi:hypothetical protein
MANGSGNNQEENGETIAKWIIGEGGREEERIFKWRKGKLCANPTNFGLITWALLWQEERCSVVVGEMVEVLKTIARKPVKAQLPGVQVNEVMRELIKHGPIGEWERMVGVTREVEITETRGKETKKRKVQQGIRGFTERQRERAEPTTDAGKQNGQNDSEDTPIREEPSMWDRQGTALANEGRDWSSVASSCPGTSRVVSQNVGPVGFRNSKRLIDSIVKQHQPEVILLQDCRVRKDKIKEATAEARKRWPKYKIFMTSSERVSSSRSRMISMVCVCL